MTKVREIAVTADEVLYRILGIHFDIWEFVMLIGHVDPEQRAAIPPEVQVAFEERLNGPAAESTE